jgi:hypothetical protein
MNENCCEKHYPRNTGETFRPETSGKPHLHPKYAAVSTICCRLGSSELMTSVSAFFIRYFRTSFLIYSLSAESIVAARALLSLSAYPYFGLVDIHTRSWKRLNLFKGPPLPIRSLWGPVEVLKEK